MARAQAPKKIQQRRDPAPRPYDGGEGHAIVSAKKDRKYVLVLKNAHIQGPDWYEDHGWKYVDPNTDEERIKGRKSRSEGQSTVEVDGHVLMCMDQGDYAELQKHGHNGRTGQAFVDRLEDAIIDREHAAADALRGIAGAARMMEVENETEPLSSFDI